MRKITKSIRPLLSAAALAAMSLGAIVDANAGDTISTIPTTTEVGHWVKLPCQPAPPSSKVPQIYIINITDLLPAGTKVTYLTNTGSGGTFKLASAVKPWHYIPGPATPPFNTCSASVFRQL
jgi:hypothetical protein